MLPLDLQQFLVSRDITIVQDNASSHHRERTCKSYNNTPTIATGLRMDSKVVSSSFTLGCTLPNESSSRFFTHSSSSSSRKKKPACRWESIPTKKSAFTTNGGDGGVVGKDVAPVLARSMDYSVIALTSNVTIRKNKENKDTPPAMYRRRNSNDTFNTRAATRVSINQILSDVLQDTDNLFLSDDNFEDDNATVWMDHSTHTV